MLMKAKLKVAAWGITGVMGAGSLFSGIAAQNVYAHESSHIQNYDNEKEFSGTGSTNDTKAVQAKNG